MKKILEIKDAIQVILDLQNLIQTETGYNFKFTFEVNDDGMIHLNVPRGFSFELRDKEENSVKKEFKGKDFIEVVESFFDFFQKKNEGKITADENNFQFRVQFHYENGWVVSNPYLRSYSYYD